MLKRHLTARFWVAASMIAVLSLVSCGEPDPAAADETGTEITSDDPAALESAAAPRNINQLVKAGDLFVAYNPAWFQDRSAPPLVATRNRQDWFALPALPDEVSSVGFGVADRRLVVTATACTSASGIELCGEDAADLEGSEAALSAWVLSEDLGTLRPIDVPDGVTAESGDIATSTHGHAASVRTIQGPLLLSPDGSTRSLTDAGIDLDGPFGFDLIGDRILTIQAEGDTTTFGRSPDVIDIPSPGAEPRTGSLDDPAYRMTSVSYVDINDPNAEPTVIAIPDEAPEVYPFLTGTEAVWVEADRELALDLSTGEFTITPLPENTLATAALVNPIGGRTGSVDLDGSVYLTPDPAYSREPFTGGVAQRDPLGRWTMVSDTPISGTALIVAADGLYAVIASTEIHHIAN